MAKLCRYEYCNYIFLFVFCFNSCTARNPMLKDNTVDCNNKSKKWFPNSEFLKTKIGDLCSKYKDSWVTRVTGWLKVKGGKMNMENENSRYYMTKRDSKNINLGMLRRGIDIMAWIKSLNRSLKFNIRRGENKIVWNIIQFVYYNIYYTYMLYIIYIMDRKNKI